MIARIAGTLISAEPNEALVDVQGVGYQLIIPLSTFEKLPAPGSAVVLRTWLKVAEDAFTLFGFYSDEERRLFKLIMTVNGIGPKLALNVLSCASVASFCAAIAAADIKALSKINGVGKRTAERMVLELKDKIGIAGFASGAISAATPGAAARSKASQEVADAVAALGTLGFRADQAEKAVETVCAALPESEHTAAHLIRRALQLLNT